MYYLHQCLYLSVWEDTCIGLYYMYMKVGYYWLFGFRRWAGDTLHKCKHIQNMILFSNTHLNVISNSFRFHPAFCSLLERHFVLLKIQNKCVCWLWNKVTTISKRHLLVGYSSSWHVHINQCEWYLCDMPWTYFHK